jgi:hypothetical protein
VELWFGFVAEQGRDGHGVHRQLAFEVPQNLKSFGIDDFRAVVCGSGEDGKIFAECDGVDLGTLVNVSFFNYAAFHVVMDEPTVIGAHEESLIVYVP